MSFPVRGKYTRISDNQREILVKHYNNGMTSKAVAYKDQIEAAAKESKLTVDQVKKWIGNEKSRRRAAATSSTAASAIAPKSPKKLPGFIKGQNKYNAFCSEVFKSDEYAGIEMKDRNKKAAQQWREIPQEKKEEYAQKAKCASSNCDSEEQRDEIIKKHKKQLFNEVMFLEDMGCEIAIILMEPSGQIFNFGSSGGESFLSSNVEMTLKFKEHFACNNEKYDYQDLTKMFNEKYSEAVGKMCRVPYLKGGFLVKGLPEGIPFRKPTHYGHKQIQAIMSCKDNIVFEITPDQCSTDNKEESQVEPENAPNSKKELLTKICGEEVARRILSGIDQQIKEDEVEVVGLELEQDERLRLCHNDVLKHFDDDAITAIKENLIHSSDVGGMVLPIYTMADEEFWLFYCNDRHPKSINRLSGRKPVKGYWLDLDTNSQSGNYKLLDQKTEIKAEALVMSAVGPLYLTTEMKIEEGQIFKPSLNFKKAIFDTLSEQGFLKNLR